MTHQSSSQLHEYQKPWLPYHDQVLRLQKRGLIIENVQSAIEFLSHSNYYRFSGYCLAFESSRHQFQDDVTFEKIKGAYDFDRALRDLVTEALEIVELDFRTAIAHYFGEKHGAFGHTASNHFLNTFKHSSWMKKLHNEANRSCELFVTHFKSTYREFPDLPIWVITELMSFGALSWMCKSMLKTDKKEIAKRYKLHPLVWTSWLHHLTYVRNLCDHHSRLWDRIWSIKPILPSSKDWQPPDLPNNNRLFSSLLILNVIMKQCPTISSYANEWRARIENLIDHPPEVTNTFELMGLTKQWKTHPLWN